MLNQTRNKIGLILLLPALALVLHSCSQSNLKPTKLSAQASQNPIIKAYDDQLIPLSVNIYESEQNQHSAHRLKESHNLIWSRIEDGLTFSHNFRTLASVKRHIHTFERSPKTVARMLSGAEPFLHFVVEEVERRNIPLEIALLPFVESRYHPLAVAHSSKAAGLWQFTRWTGRFYGLNQDWWYDARFDVYESTSAALNLLQDLHDKYDDWLLALAAYNWGMGNLDRSIRKAKAKGIRNISFWNIRLPKETSNYVPKLIALSHIVANRHQYPTIVFPNIKNESQLAPVRIDHPYEVALLAAAADISIEEFRLLNAGLRRWAVKPDSQINVMVPIEISEQFHSRVNSFNASNKDLKWRNHVVESGDSLYDLARYYGVSIKILKSTNRLTSNTIHIGQRLIIPIKAI